MRLLYGTKGTYALHMHVCMYRIDYKVFFLQFYTELIITCMYTCGIILYHYSIQALWSYTNQEILFDREFVSMVSHKNRRWQVDFSKLSVTVPCHRDTSLHESETSDL